MTVSPREAKAKILHHRRIAPDSFRLQLHCPEISRLARPGQFVMLRVNELRDPFLRRPFSFSRIFRSRKKKGRPVDEGAIEICYQVVGRGTSWLSQLREGQGVDLLGPLGNGFTDFPGQKRAILIGGGIGIAPLLAWAEELRTRGNSKRKAFKVPPEALEVLVLVGAKSREKVLGLKDCQRMGLEAQVATEDGSLGILGLATDLLERELLTGGHDSTSIYACGPTDMLARVAGIADQFDLPCQVLLEARMACGVGACLGCTVKVREGGLPEGGKNGEGPAEHEIASEVDDRDSETGTPRERFMPAITEPPPFHYARVCKEGPVFEAREIFWD